MEDNIFLENIDFTENLLTQDQIKRDLILPTQYDSSVDSNESTVQHTTIWNCWSNVVQNPYTNEKQEDEKNGKIYELTTWNTMLKVLLAQFGQQNIMYNFLIDLNGTSTADFDSILTHDLKKRI